MNVLITGGTGFIGYHLSNFHANKGDNVVIFDNLFKINRNQDKHIKEIFKRENVVFYDVDLSNKIEVDLPFEIDVVYHLAAINGTKLFYTIPYELCKNNILATINLFDFLEGQDIKKIVYSSDCPYNFKDENKKFSYEKNILRIKDALNNNEQDKLDNILFKNAKNFNL